MSEVSISAENASRGNLFSATLGYLRDNFVVSLCVLFLSVRVLLLLNVGVVWILAGSLGVVLLLRDKRLFLGMALILLVTILVNSVQEKKDDLILRKSLEIKEGDLLSGVISSDPRYDHCSSRYIVQTDKNEFGGKVIVQAARFPRFIPGMDCSFKIRKIHQLDSGYVRYLKSKGIYLSVDGDGLMCTDDLSVSYLMQLRKGVYRVKNSVTSQVNQFLFEPYASLYLGMLFGDQRLFEESFEESIRVAGLTHIIAASGFNVSLIKNVIEKLTRRVMGLRYRTVIILVGVWTFALMADLSGSILRASTMMSIYLICKLVGRPYHSVDGLVYTCAILIGLNRYILYDAGFLLSASAMVGLMIGTPVLERLQQYIPKVFQTVLQLSGETLVCLTGTNPISYFSFGSAQFSSVIPNVLVLSLVEISYWLGICGIIAQMVGLSFLAHWLFHCVKLLLFLFEQIVIWFESSIAGVGGIIDVSGVLVFDFILMTILILAQSRVYPGNHYFNLKR